MVVLAGQVVAVAKMEIQLAALAQVVKATQAVVQAVLSRPVTLPLVAVVEQALLVEIQ
jgi:hypothetical protein